ncbi:hypothetical protein [Sphingopyxis sp. LK2115]|jgi:hypothetical protein|nr:hypothetical protein [Sphingopyxis sp. LK2115]
MARPPCKARTAYTALFENGVNAFAAVAGHGEPMCDRDGPPLLFGTALA